MEADFMVIDQALSICLVTPSHISANPRVVKEADALCKAGFVVRVLFAQGTDARARQRDRDVLSEKRWAFESVDYGRATAPTVWLRSGLRHRVNRELPEILWRSGATSERAEGRVYTELADLAASRPADVYIGHYPTGLAAAHAAAKTHRGLLGFDAEDFHTGEAENENENGRVHFLQRRYLPQCDFVTAASAGIAERLAQEYNIECPLTIYNTFPWAERAALDGKLRDRRGNDLSLYWYSQTIGLDRGLQDAIRAAGRVGQVQLHLRGTVSQPVRAELLALAHSVGIADRLFFHEQVSPRELLSRSAEHDIGLALEQGQTINRAICTTNKLFFYMLSGLAIAATDVPGQRLVVTQSPGLEAVLYAPGDIDRLTAGIQAWAGDRESLARAKATSLSMARDCWNWENEARKLVDFIRSKVAKKRVALMRPHSAMTANVGATG